MLVIVSVVVQFRFVLQCLAFSSLFIVYRIDMFVRFDERV